MKNKFFLKKDILVILILIIVSAVIYCITSSYYSDKKVYAEILHDKKVIKKVDLSQPSEFSLPDIPNITFEVKDNAIAFTHSDCPDKICVKTGFISHAGSSAACLPNKTVVRIVSDSPDDADAVS
ncbi:MAG: NusG domain II-containing protein [Firmicutes bacterium]|nr:NusG domain II-containing protein [Bacillota bacterium]